jgi:hypothetical protein
MKLFTYARYPFQNQHSLHLFLLYKNSIQTYAALHELSL